MVAVKELWPFQVEGIKFLEKHKRVILADQMGIGKTRQVIKVIEKRVLVTECSVLVICAKKNAMYVWMKKELPKWSPELAEAFVSTESKSPTERETIWKEMLCVVTNHQTIMRDREIVPKEWDIIILEEPHTWLRSRKTKTFKFMKTMRSEFLIIMTGTPTSKGAHQLWPMLHLINRKVFSSYWRFVNSFCHVDDGPWGKDVYGTRNEEALKDLLSRYMLRRLKAEVFPDMPPKLVDTIPIMMTPEQGRVHTELLKDLLTLLGGELILTPNTMTCVLRLRQLLVCPKLLNLEAGLGAGIEYLQEVTSDLDPADRHFTIFTPFKQALPFIGQALDDVGTPAVYLYGGMSTTLLAEAINTYDQERCVAVCVIKYAESFSLASASLGYFLGAEWDYTECEQAEDRMHRAETAETVNIHYLQHLNSVDERVMEVLSQGHTNVSQYLTSPRALQKLILGDKP